MALLGPLHARLRIQRGKVAIALQAGGDDAVGLLRQHGPELLAAMASAGLAVSDLSMVAHAD